MDRQCSSCGGFCKKSGCERENVQPEPEPEPVAVWELQEGGWDTIADADWMETLPVGTKLYTAPPKKEWVGLTDNEIWKDDGIMAANSGYGATFETLRELVRAIEVKLKDKNNG